MSAEEVPVKSSRAARNLVKPVVAMLLALMCGSLLSGCSANGLAPFLGAGPCMPPEFRVSSPSAAAGSQVTVSANRATCDPAYGENAQIKISLTDRGGQKAVEALAPMADDGAFTYTLRVPPNMLLGQAAVQATPHNVDWCDDTGQNNRKAKKQHGANIIGAPTSQDLELASCTAVLVNLEITAQAGNGV